LGQLGIAATNGLLCQPQVIMMMGEIGGMTGRGTEVLGENLPQCCFVLHEPHMLPRREPGTPWREASEIKYVYNTLVLILE
jgi:hypothetical protein